MLLRQTQPTIIWNPQKQHFFPVRYIIAVNSPILGGSLKILSLVFCSPALRWKSPAFSVSNKSKLKFNKLSPPFPQNVTNIMFVQHKFLGILYHYWHAIVSAV